MTHGYLAGFISYSNEFHVDPHPLFQMIPSNRTVGQSTTSMEDKTLFECFFHCNLNPNCSAINLQNYNYDGGLYDKVQCDLIETPNGSGYTVVPDLQSYTFVKTSLLFNSVTTHFNNVTYPSFNIRETIQVPKGGGEEYCFQHCSQLDSSCHGLQIQKSCATKKVESCQILDSPLPNTMPLQANCSWDIHLKETGEYTLVAQERM